MRSYAGARRALAGLNALRADAGLSLNHLPMLTSVAALGTTTELAQLEIAYCDGLNNLLGLNNLRRIGDELIISFNGQLLDIQSLLGVEGATGARVVVQNNTLLDQCAVWDMVAGWNCESVAIRGNGACQ